MHVSVYGELLNRIFDVVEAVLRVGFCGLGVQVAEVGGGFVSSAALEVFVCEEVC